jgi:hypothetical protein
MEKVGNAYGFLVGKLKGRNYLQDVGVDERIILKVRNRVGGYGLDTLDPGFGFYKKRVFLD